MPYVIEVDQSFKIGNTSKATVVAFADGKERAILIPAEVKRKIIQELRRRGKGVRLYYLLFATLLYLLLKEDIENIERVTIDIEYRQKEAMIKGHLLNLLRRAGKRVDGHQIQFARITKKSPAHRVAIKTLRKQRPPDHKVTFEELLREFPEK
jgi:hypothetical protein